MGGSSVQRMVPVAAVDSGRELDEALLPCREEIPVDELEVEDEQEDARFAVAAEVPAIGAAAAEICTKPPKMRTFQRGNRQQRGRKGRH